MKKPTVTVALSALNEEKNIMNFLKSVLMQKEKGFVLKQIWIHSDGSKDNTVKLARSLKSKKIKVWDHKIRTGKSNWLNKIYEDLDTDFLVQSDADVIFAHDLVIHDLIQPLIQNKDVMMTGGHPQPIRAKTFIESAINLTFEPFAKFRMEVRGGNNVFSADGRLLAYKKEFVKKITVPITMIANDVFTFFCCLSSGYKYRYVPTAVVYFRSPQSLKDHLKQNIRFESAEIRMKKFFKEELVDMEFSIPTKLLIKHLLIAFAKSPIKALVIYLINVYCRFIARKKEGKLTAVWLMAISTKKI